MNANEHNVFLKLQAFDESDGLYINTIPLKAESVDFNTDKTIPAFPIPLSGAITGEATTVALDLGMSNKTVSVKGIITDQTITKKHGNDPAKIRNFTSHEIAQMIASGVDSTGLAEHQAFNELVILMPSIVDKNYDQVTERNIPFTWKSRGSNLKLDNARVPLPSTFPDSEEDEGLKGFIRSFGVSFNSENRFIDFSLEFQVALILP